MRSTRYMKIVLFAAATLLLAACGSPKRIVYMQDVVTGPEVPIGSSFEIRIQPDDMLGITVNSQDPELALPFNMPVVAYQAGRAEQLSSVQQLQGHLVDSEGNINFPILGKIAVVGMTRRELTNLLEKQIRDGNYISDPVVTIKFLNFKVSVMGEVARPGAFPVESDRITVLEALSQAGDLTIYGRRDRVIVVREEGDKRQFTCLDLRRVDLFESPCYYLQQNDVVYVEPNKRKAEQSGINQNNTLGVWVSVLSLLTTAAVLIFK